MKIALGVKQAENGEFIDGDVAFAKLRKHSKSRRRKASIDLQAVASIKNGLKQVRQGKTNPASKVFAAIRKKHKIPNKKNNSK